MDIPVQQVSLPAPIHGLGCVDFTGYQFGMAPTALAATAMGRSGDTGGFQRAEQGHIAGGGDGLLCSGNAYRYLEGRGHMA